MKDIVIIGAGPAGLSAGVYCARRMLDTLVIARDIGGQAVQSWQVENYLGYQLISGAELAERFREHLENFKVELKEGSAVKSVRKDGNLFHLETMEGEQLTGRAVLVASGKVPRALGVPGEEKFRGRGVSYCAICDGPLFRKKKVAVIGGGNAALDAALQLAQISDEVHVITKEPYLRGDEIRRSGVLSSEVIKVYYSSQVTGISGNVFVEGIDFIHDDQERSLPVEGIFVEVGSVPSTSFLPPEVELNQQGEIVINANNETSMEGLLAAGDVTNVAEKQIIIAAGEGAKASLAAYHWLLMQGLLGTK